MAAPIAALVGGTILGTAVGGVTSAYMQPLSRRVAYDLNYTYPNVVPGVSEAIDAYHRGHISYVTLYKTLRDNGVRSMPNASELTLEGTWAKIIESAKPVPGIEMLCGMYDHGEIDLANFRERIKRTGLDPLDIVGPSKYLYSPLNSRNVISQHRLGVYDWQQTLELLRYSDTADPVKIRHFMQESSPFTLEILLELIRRNLITAESVAAHLSAIGFPKEIDQERLRNLRYVYPSQSALIQIAVKDVFDPDVVRANRLLEEYPEQLHQWSVRSGANYSFATYPADSGLPASIDYLQAQWAAHWRNIDPTTAFQLLHRLRPERIAMFRQMGYDVEPFTINDVRRWLKVNDYPPGVRDAMAAISHNVLRLVDINNAIVYGIRDRQWAVEQYLDRGYNQNDAQFAADLSQERKWRAEHAPAITLTKRIMASSFQRSLQQYVENRISRAQAITNIAIDVPNADTAAFVVDQFAADYASRRQSKSISSVRSYADRIGTDVAKSTLDLLVSKSITDAEATARMSRLGLMPDEIKRLIDARKLKEEATESKKRRSIVESVNRSAVSRVIRSTLAAMRQGIVTNDRAITILTSSGVDVDAAKSIVSSEAAMISVDEAKIAISSVRKDYLQGKLTRQDALNALSRIGVSARVAAFRVARWDASRTMKRESATLAMILAWVKRGLMPVDVARIRLANLGWSGIDSQLLLADAVSQLNERVARARDAVDRKRAQQSNQLEKLHAKATGQVKEIQSELRRVTPISVLRKWYLSGMVSEAYVRVRMSKSGYPSDVISKYICEWTDKVNCDIGATEDDEKEKQNAESNGEARDAH